MNFLSEHNRILQGSLVYTAGGDVYNSGWEYTPSGEISGYSGSAIYTGEGCQCDSAAVVDSAFNKSTAWANEQNYLTAHQDVTNLPYVQNSALDYSPQGLISGISGVGIYATSAESALNAKTANFAYSSDEANAAKWASSAEYVYNGWELDNNNNITGYSGTAFAANHDYSGISPIVVDNEQRIISAESARLGVQDPLYFVEDSISATIIGIHDSAFSGRDWTDDIASASANAYNQAVSNITAVNSALTANYAKSSDSATYDSLGRKIVDTYLTAHQDWGPTISAASGNAYNSAVNWVVDQHYLTAVTGDNTPYTEGANINITNHVVSGKDWTDTIQAASSYAVDQATAQIPAVTGLPYVENSALAYTPGGHLVSSISGDAIYAVSADGAFNAETANYSYTAETANYVEGGWEFNTANQITGYSGSAFAATGGGKVYTGVAPIVVNNTEDKISANTIELSAGNGIDISETANKVVISCTGGGEGKVYTGVSPIVVDNTQTTGVISAKTASFGVQSPLYFVTDTSAQTVIGFSGIQIIADATAATATGVIYFVTGA